KFDLTLLCEETADTLLCTLEYSTELFKEETIVRIAGYYKELLKGLTGNRQQEIAELEILPHTEKALIIEKFNSEAGTYPTDKTIHGLFKEQVEKTPENICLVDSIPVAGKKQSADQKEHPKKLTYRQLDEKAEDLAAHLHTRGVTANELVGILADRTSQMIIGMLAILKAGCGYVPLNPKAPAQRNKYMLDECAVNLLLTVASLENEAKNIDSQRNIICVETRSPQLTADKEKRDDGGTPNNQSSLSLPNNQSFAYVIFTSGSTGKPKGVPITHANFSPLIHWGYRELEIGSDDRALQNLSYYFDWSVWEIFIILTSGASLYMIPEELQMDPGACIDFISENKITVYHATPTQWQYLLPSGRTAAESGNVKKQLHSLRYLCIGAEKLTLDLVQRSIATISQECRIFNMYGPTEATIISATLEINKEKLVTYKQLSSVPIGEPTGNSQLLVLDKYLKPVPLTVEGELYIGGEGVSIGYLNNPELSAARFVEDSRQYAVGSRQEEKQEKANKKEIIKKEKTSPNNQYPLTNNTLYRTGDRVRWQPDGTVEFLGRFDFQVKIRGFRIELG
ncbi:MAG: amino acid adenylation domain-containing protein, partial [bacterium]|nr:amino acid adenylation domain-containing protein [bacterium]